MSDAVRHRALGALIGLAVGDALGTTLEFETRDAKPPLRDMVGGGPFNLLPGQWTDDTAMALCLADSIIACGGSTVRNRLRSLIGLVCAAAEILREKMPNGELAAG